MGKPKTKPTTTPTITMSDTQRRWMLKVASHEFWRVASWYELDDLIQDGLMCFHKVVKRYPEACSNPAHIGKLFQTTFINHIRNLARQRSHSVHEAMSLDSYFADPDEHPNRGLDAVMANTGNYILPQTQVLDKAPTFVQEAFRLYAEDDKRLKPKPRRNGRGYRETLNERLCRLIGLEPTMVDVPTMIRQYLSPSDKPVRKRSVLP